MGQLWRVLIGRMQHLNREEAQMRKESAQLRQIEYRLSRLKAGISRLRQPVSIGRSALLEAALLPTLH